jgi:hypothetical protein
MDVVRVKAGVAPPLDVPVNPLAETTETAVTLPEPLLLKVVQSVLVRYPLTLPVAAAMLIAGVAPPEDTTGAVPLTEVTVPLPLLLKVVQSAALKAPRLVAEAVGTCKVITGVVVPVATVDDRSVPVVPKVNAATLVTVPLVLDLPLKVFQSVDVKYPFTEVVAAGMDIAGVLPPLDTTGAVPVTLVTVPPEDGLVLVIVKLGYVPLVEIPVPAVKTTVWSGAELVIVNVPLVVIGLPDTVIPVPAVAATLVTVPTETDPPRAVLVPLIVMVEFVRLVLPILESVLLAPEIVLLVKVCVPVSVATVLSIDIVPLVVIGPPVKPVPVATLVTVPNGFTDHELSVPLVVKYLPVLPVWLGARALNPSLAVEAPVPPFATGTVPVSVWSAFQSDG